MALLFGIQECTNVKIPFVGKDQVFSEQDKVIAQHLTILENTKQANSF
jgi:hypothetical protein